MNPSDAVDDAIASFRAQGFVLAAREDAESFAAFGAEHSDGRSVVRIASERGWVLAVTAPSENHSRPWVRLLPGTFDTDGNGRAELLVAAPDVVRGVVCASMVEIVDGGAVERHADFAAYGGEGCIVGRADADPSRLIAHVFYPALSRGVVPEIRLVLGAGFRVEDAAGVAVAPVGEESEEEVHQVALGWARAVEAAASRLALGEDTAAQLRAFEAHADCTALATECAGLRGHIERGWTNEVD